MKKKILFFNLILILLFSCAFNAHAYDVAKSVRIGIKYGSSSVSSSEISADNGFLIKAYGEEEKIIAETNLKSLFVECLAKDLKNSYLVVEQSGFKDMEDANSYCEGNGWVTVPYYRNGHYYAVREGLYNSNDAEFALSEAKNVNETSYLVEPTEKRIKLKESKSGKTVLIFSEDDGDILALEDYNDGTLTIKDLGNFEDSIEFIRTGNALKLVNNVSMNIYLYSVVAAEIGASSPLEAQKAQAVCARTYAIGNLNRHSADGFNLCATTHCQVYSGTKNVRPLTVTAVDETKNLILTYNNKPISAVYYAHSGGYTANVEDVWGSPYPYLKSVEDKYCGDYEWKYKIDFDEITKRMEEKGYSIGTVTSIKVLEATENGIVTKLKIAGTKGSKTFERESARTILGLKSQQFQIPYEDLSYSVKSSKGTSVKTVSSILTASGKVDAAGSINIKNAAGKITVISAREGGIVEGKGYGHQVGMSQHGAMGYAREEGWTFDKILKHYYQGVTIEGE